MRSPDCGQRVIASGVRTSSRTARSPAWIAAKKAADRLAALGIRSGISHRMLRRMWLHGDARRAEPLPPRRAGPRRGGSRARDRSPGDDSLGVRPLAATHEGAAENGDGIVYSRVAVHAPSVAVTLCRPASEGEVYVTSVGPILPSAEVCIPGLMTGSFCSLAVPASNLTSISTFGLNPVPVR